jgi:hypothetical protein
MKCKKHSWRWLRTDYMHDKDPKSVTCTNDNLWEVLVKGCIHCGKQIMFGRLYTRVNGPKTTKCLKKK